MTAVVDKTEDYIADAKDLLRRWGFADWQERQLGGYARQTLEQVMTEHGFIPRAQGKAEAFVDPDLLFVDEVVSQLNAQRSGAEIVAALWLWYAVRKVEIVESCTRDGRPMNEFTQHDAGRLTEAECTKVMHCSRTHFRRLRDHGHTWVAGALSRR